MTRLAASVAIRTPRSGRGAQVIFNFPTTGQTVSVPLRNRDAIRALRSKAGYYLDRLLPMVGASAGRGGDVGPVLGFLLNAGRELALLLVGHDTNRLFTLEDAFRAAWSTWARADWDDAEQTMPAVDVVSHDETLPLELIPFFDFGPPRALRTSDEIARAASRFLGFTASVRRVLPSSIQVGDNVLRNVPTLPVQLIRHRSLRGSETEETFLSSMRDFISIDGPWPQMQDNAEVVDALARALYEGTSLCKEIPPDPPIQIHHFSCHSNTSSEHYDDYTLRLSTRRGARREISFAQLRTAHLDQLASDAGRRSPRSRAVIILNSCASSRTDPLTAVSFPLWFLKCGHRAFIGTEADVPDMVAARFAESLYGRILEYRRPLGEALVWARRDLLRDFRNPLGLLYAAYGNSDLMIEAARPGSYRAARRSNVA